MLNDDHSLMGGSHDTWSGGVVGLFGRPLSCCTVLCAWPLDVGIFCVSCALFRLPIVGQGYNEHDALCNCNSLCTNLPSDLRLSGEDLRSPFPCIKRCKWRVLELLESVVERLGAVP